MITKKVVAVIIQNYKGEILILKRSSQKEVHANLWNLPSGMVENGETLEEASIRETFEETGLKIKRVIGGISENVKISEKVTLKINYLLSHVVISNVKLNLENTDYKWVKPEESTSYEFAIPKSKVVKILKYFELL